MDETTALNELLLNTMPIGMDIVDEKGTILFMNKMFENIFGKDAVGKKCYDVYRDDKRQCGRCPLKMPIEINKTAIMTSSGVAGGKIFQISHTGIIYQGKKSVMEMFVDITDIKKYEDKLLANAKELETFNKIAVDRELKMIELKKQLEELNKRKNQINVNENVNA